MCGLTGIVSPIKSGASDTQDWQINISQLNETVSQIEERPAGKELIASLSQAVRSLKRDASFADIFADKEIQNELSTLAERLSGTIDLKVRFLAEQAGHLRSEEVDTISRNIEELKDITWCLSREIGDNVTKIRELFSPSYSTPRSSGAVKIFKNINAVMNSIDRLEVRGRDSAGISLLFILKDDEFEKFRETLGKDNLLELLAERSEGNVLVNRSVSVSPLSIRNETHTAIAFTYKVAAEIGRLGDNTDFLRGQVREDDILQTVALFPNVYHTVLSHTRWASVGAITEPNCHPVDNDCGFRISDFGLEKNPVSGIIHVCLNGDIDNYLKLKKEYEHKGNLISEDITTDTKIIPLRIEKYIQQGMNVTEAFRLAMNDFDGSHAICMHTPLAPGKFFLAQKGSGQAIFIGLAEDHYMPASEVYGFVEETPFYLKVDGEKTVEGKNGTTQGQIFVLDQNSEGGLDGISAMYYDGTPLELGKEDIKHTEITSRDIDRQGFSHYFLKEISESPVSVERTLQNRWKIKDSDKSQYAITLDETVFPKSLQDALIGNQIRRIFFVGQGTAGIAAQGCADILNYYMKDPLLAIRSLKASELSGFTLHESDDAQSMRDTLVIAISQSGTTTDTNRTVDMVKERGAHTLAIVNRRDSDITFKVDGVIYTSSGRDIEMSVASTKAFYSQIVAGALLGLYMAGLKEARTDEFVTEEIRQLQKLPDQMRKILSLCDQIGESARRIATTRAYWAVVGSGPNKTSADEIRIKLSELCYKTISSDYVEDKKHIDLSAEPLIIVCAAGTRETVIGDIIKDVAIFHAHKALPLVIVNEGDDRFDSYAEDVVHVPAVSEHLAPIVNTLVGHIWGYYAALAINDGSQFLYTFREEIQADIEDYAEKGTDVYEIILEERFREKIARFYNEFKTKKAENRLPSSMGFVASSDLTLLLKYLSGRLPIADFELDFGVKGTAMNMLNKLFECLGKSINGMARPVDAIKHQAKTVTVGTSRISEKTEGILFDALGKSNLNASQLTASNIIVMKNLQGIVSEIKGSTLYKISGLNLLGESTDETSIEVVKREGTSKSLNSRVENDAVLKGTKKIIVRTGNVYIGKGRKDNRSILVIPIISDSPSAPNMTEYLLLLEVSFRENVPLDVKIKALGGKYEHIVNTVQEHSVPWDDKLLEHVEISELFGKSAEKIGDFIVSSLNQV